MRINRYVCPVHSIGGANYSSYHKTMEEAQYKYKHTGWSNWDYAEEPRKMTLKEIVREFLHRKWFHLKTFLFE